MEERKEFKITPYTKSMVRPYPPEAVNALIEAGSAMATLCFHLQVVHPPPSAWHESLKKVEQNWQNAMRNLRKG